MSIMELMQGCLNREELKTVTAFIRENFYSIIHPSEEISEKAILLIERFGLSHGLRTVDSLIAASALLKNFTVATANLKHYRAIANLKVLQFRT